MTVSKPWVEKARLPTATVVLLALASALAACAAETAAPLPRLPIDSERIAVVGISSGAIMAQQAHFAFSDRLRGAVLLAGPPYGCAEGSLEQALGRCLKATPAPPDANQLARMIEARAAGGQLADLRGLEGDRVAVLHGKLDQTVAASVARVAHSLYEQLEVGASMRLSWDGDGDFAHLWPTVDGGGDCGVSGPPYLGHCGRDFGAEIFAALFDQPRAQASGVNGEVVRFDQTAFNPPNEDSLLGAEGFLYRPPQCRDKQRCGLLIAFHGCEQNVESVGERFVLESGLNRWADVYDVVVLYPQTRATYLPLNPKACWDWWGYSGPDYDTRQGVQLRWLANLAAALGAPLN
jgi:poly(3-hydroxybutyrate) depolymerase